MEKTEVVAKIIEYVGGKDNVANVDYCATRLRFEVKDSTAVNEKAVKAAEPVVEKAVEAAKPAAEKAVEAVKTAAAKTNTRKGGKGKRRK